MIRYISSIHRFKLSLLLGILLVLPVAAQQAPIEVVVTVKGDSLILDTKTSAGQPKLRMNPDPAFLELSFPASALSGQPMSKAIDKGLIRKVVTASAGQESLVRVYVLSKPKATLSKTDTGYRYTVKLNEMANAPARTTTEPTETSSAPASPETPAEQPAEKPIATKPVEPTKPVETTKPVQKPVEKPAEKPVEKPIVKPVEKPVVQPVSTQTQPVRTVTPNTTPAPSPKTVREYFPFKNKSAEKAMAAAKLAFPNVSYIVDPVLNILMVEGTAAEIQELEKFLRAQSPK